MAASSKKRQARSNWTVDPGAPEGMPPNHHPSGSGPGPGVHPDPEVPSFRRGGSAESPPGSDAAVVGVGGSLVWPHTENQIRPGSPSPGAVSDRGPPYVSQYAISSARLHAVPSKWTRTSESGP